jgi:hypothetical protein
MGVLTAYLPGNSRAGPGFQGNVTHCVLTATTRRAIILTNDRVLQRLVTEAELSWAR